MSKVETYQCDQCKTQKKETNAWWKVFLLDADKDDVNVGVVILKWEINSITRPFSHPEVLPDKADAHLCGANCVTEWLSRNLLP